MQMVVQSLNRLADQLLCLEIHHIGRLGVDVRPQFLKLLPVELLLIETEFHVVAPCILGSKHLLVVDRIEDMHHRLVAGFHLLRQLEAAALFVLIVLIGQGSRLYVTITRQALVEDQGSLLAHGIGITLFVRKHLIAKQRRRNFLRPVGDHLGDLRLERLGKPVIALARDHRQLVDVMNLASQEIGVHALPLLVHA
ncbi:MAG: hypothetical protein BWY95_01382 [Bacteroidetes bacterium ADurb.BinA104]|nr:MAG: hypothetical protein BWY95_01382 [Bacteroidetes bacterium ADurb.BinA104]